MVRVVGKEGALRGGGEIYRCQVPGVTRRYDRLKPDAVFNFIGRAPLGRREQIWLAWFAGKSAGRQLASPADLPTKVSGLANGIYRFVRSREILQTHSSNLGTTNSIFLMH